jgi:hypothetical protein
MLVGIWIWVSKKTGHVNLVSFEQIGTDIGIWIHF